MLQQTTVRRVGDHVEIVTRALVPLRLWQPLEVVETTGEEIPAPSTGYLRLLPGGRAA